MRRRRAALAIVWPSASRARSWPVAAALFTVDLLVEAGHAERAEGEEEGEDEGDEEDGRDQHSGSGSPDGGAANHGIGLFSVRTLPARPSFMTILVSP